MIVLYKGKRGCGKTLTMVKDAYSFKKEGWRVLANFKVSFADPISNDDVLSLNKDSGLKDCVLLLDEIQIFFDSRLFKKAINIRFSNFLQQIRKRNIVILTTTQYSNTIDLRLRQHIDIVALPRFFMKSQVVDVIYYDLATFDDYYDKNPSTFRCVFYAFPYYSLYDSYEMIV